MSSKYPDIFQYFGLTQDSSNGNYMLVMNRADMDLRKYLQQNHNQLTWKERIQISINIIVVLHRIHDENIVHKNLHSGNILTIGDKFFVSDFGFCGPADKPLKSIYGNLPYIAPEVIVGKEKAFKSDIYSVAMLMWEISSGQPPFINYEHNNDLAIKIVNGIRPKVVPGTPSEYENLMKQCWDADPLKRPDINTLFDNLNKLNQYYQHSSHELIQPKENNSSVKDRSIDNINDSNSFISKLYQFDNFPEPRNATEGIILII
jgi:serine/threonine protein kinase